MPLRERTVVDIREEMVLRSLSGKYTLAEVASEFGVSIPTVRLWRDRYRELGRGGLSDRSHAPHSSPWKTDAAIEALIVEDRERFGFGSKKVRRRLIDAHPEIQFPARSTIDGIFTRHGLVEPQRRPARKARSPFIQRYPATEPGELMTLDHKGQFRLRNGVYCFPLTICDSVSRYLIACEALTNTSFAQAWPVIERVLRERGLPRAAQSDNGPPFGGTSGRFSTMSVHFMRLGIQPVFSRPGRPGDNGSHERMHRDLKRETTRPPCATIAEQQKLFDSFCHIYNVERPHEAIGQERPATLYKGSDRPYPKRIPKPDYDAHLDKRTVSETGSIKWRDQPIFLSQALRGQTVGLEPAANATIKVHFYNFVIGKIDEEQLRFI